VKKGIKSSMVRCVVPSSPGIKELIQKKESMCKVVVNLIILLNL